MSFSPVSKASRLAVVVFLPLALLWYFTAQGSEAGETAHVPQASIDRAIGRGASYLKALLLGKARLPQKDRLGRAVVRGFTERLGAKALAGVTLLACGVSSNDEAVMAVASEVRKNAWLESQTYDVALCLMFLDSLKQREDEDLLRSLTLRLIASQRRFGGWDYKCFLLSPAQEDKLLAILRERQQPEGKTKESTPGPVEGTDKSAVMPNDLADLPVFQYRPGTLFAYRPHAREDNSLTQFAVMALWAARKHGIPVARSIAFVDSHFRSSQLPDGSWYYTYGEANRCKNSMTCAGLVGLAIAAAERPEKSPAPAASILSDSAVRKGMEFLGEQVGSPEVANWFERGLGSKEAGRFGADAATKGWGGLYYLWSIERVGMLYNVKTIGGKDWYSWGAKIILRHQLPDGSWLDTFPGAPDTSFALLFLRRYNVAPDATELLNPLRRDASKGR